MAIRAGAATHRGSVRPNNEDSYAVLLPPDLIDGLDVALVVADGMGGAEAGEVASRIIVNHVVARFSRDPVAIPFHDAWSLAIQTVIVEANQLVHQAALETPERRGMGSTVVLGLVAGDRLHLGSVGDSRAYLLSDGQIYQLSRDHSWVADEVLAGRLTQVQARHHPRRNLLTRAVGVLDTVSVDQHSYELMPGDRVLLCTDGVTGAIADHELCRLSSESPDPVRFADDIIAHALDRGARDNVTVVVADYDSDA